MCGIVLPDTYDKKLIIWSLKYKNLISTVSVGSKYPIVPKTEDLPSQYLILPTPAPSFL